jgi:hypothetical protein
MARQAFWAAMVTASVKAGKANCVPVSCSGFSHAGIAGPARTGSAQTFDPAGN